MKRISKILLACFFYCCMFQPISTVKVFALDEYNNAVNIESEQIHVDKTSYYDLLKAAVETIKFENFNLAEKYLSIAIRLNPKEYKAWQLLSVVYMEKKMFKNAYVCAKNAYDINPKNNINKFNLGQFLNKQDKEEFFYNKENQTIIINSVKSRDIVKEALEDGQLQSLVNQIDTQKGFELSDKSFLARTKKSN